MDISGNMSPDVPHNSTNSLITDENDLSRTSIEGAELNDSRIMGPTKLEVDQNGKNKRNTFACVSCHALKQKCVPSDKNDMYRKPCERCLKQKKKCKFDLSRRTRKRRIRNPKAVTLVSENSSNDTVSPTPTDSAAISPVVISPSLNSNMAKKRSFSNMSNLNSGASHSLTNIMNAIDSAATPSPPNSSINTCILPIPAVTRTQSNTNLALWSPITGNIAQQNKSITSRAPPTTTNISNMIISPNALPITENDLVDQSNVEKNSSFPIPTTVHSDTDPNARTPTFSEAMRNADISDLIPANNDNKNNRGLLVTPFVNKNIDLQNKRRRKTHYHMKRTFKKSLQSLLIVLKGKISDISNKFNLWSKEWNKLVESSMFLPSISDPVSIGIISMEEAKLRLQLYKNVIANESRLPFVNISEDATVNDVRKEKPIFFSVAMSIVSIVMTEEQTTRDTVMRLDSFVINLITMQIFKLNNKSVEMIEALVTLCMWYNFLEWSSKTRYHLFNYICCCLTKDLGPTSVNRSFGMFNDEAPYKYKPHIKTPLELAENGSTLTVLVYISALNISIFLRQSVQTRWNRLTEDAIREINGQILKFERENNDKNELSKTLRIEENKLLIIFAELNHLLEKIHIHLHEMMEIKEEEGDADRHLFSQEYSQRLILKYQKDLDKVFAHIPKSRARFLAFYYSVEAYLHQFTISEFFRTVYDKNTLIDLPGNVQTAFIKCYECCQMSLTEFLKLPPTLIASLPLFHMSRIIYIVGMMMLKLRYSVVAVPAFHHLIDLTEGSIALVKKVSNKLAEASEMYPYNTALYKFQYVVALFGQTYASKVTELAENVERDHPNSIIQFNSRFLDRKSEPASARESANASEGPVPAAVSDGSATMNEGSSGRQEVFNPALPGRRMTGGDNFSGGNGTMYAHEGSGAPMFNAVGGSPSTSLNPTLLQDGNGRIPDGTVTGGAGNGAADMMKATSPSISSENLNEYLTDINSLAWGYNALNDEFWTDLLFNNI